MKKPKSFIAIALTAAGLLSSSIAYAVGPDSDPAALIEETKKSFLFGDMGNTMVSEYVTRGVVVENQGVIAQPYLDIYAKVYEGTGFIDSVSAGLSFFASIHSHVQPIGSTDTTRNWFEFDYDPVIAVSFAKHFVLTLTNINAESPASAFRTARVINAVLDFNDSSLLGAYALHPHLTVLRELAAQVALGPHGWYYELGIAPTYVVARERRYPVTFVLSLVTGFGSNNFYAGNFFGFASGKLTAAVPLAFIPPGYGTWTATAGYNYNYIGTNLANETATGHRNQHVFSSTIGMTF